MKKSPRPWVNPILAILGYLIAGLLPVALGPVLYAAFPHADWRDVGLASVSLFGGSLLVGLALEVGLLIGVIVKIRRHPENRSNIDVVTIVLSAAGTLLLGSPIAIGLVGSLLPH